MFKRDPVPGEIIEVSIGRFRGFGLCPSAVIRPTNPFVQLVKILLNGGEVNPEGSPLDKYYKRVQPASAAEVVGLPKRHPLVKLPPLGAVLPWYFSEPEEHLKAMQTGVIGYYLQHNKADWTLEDGHTQFGPVSNRKLESEIERFANLIDSVRTEGYLEDRPPVLGNILFDDRGKKWVCDIKDGLHRVVVFAAFGMTLIPVRVLRTVDPVIVRRSASSEWTHVKSGLFTERQALKIFDRYVEGVRLA